MKTKGQNEWPTCCHWLRHTSISDDVKCKPCEHVRDNASHSSSQTTDRCIDIDSREWHQRDKNKLSQAQKGWR